MAVQADLTFVAASPWIAPASAATISPTYPTGLAEGDRVYAVIHVKPSTATVATPTDWSPVGNATGGGGAVGPGTGPTRIYVFKRDVPSGGLTGSQAFTITGGSSPVAHMQGWRPIGPNPVWDTESTTSYSRATASTAAGGTGAANLSLVAKQVVVAVVGTTDDTTTNINITSLTAVGATLAALVKAPSAAQNTNATITNSQGNDIAAASAYAVVTAGTSSAGPAVVATANASETGMGFFFKVGAVVDDPVTHSGAATVTGSAAITATGSVLNIVSGAATQSVTASVTAAGVAEAPSPPAVLTSEPGYALIGAVYPGAVWTTADMGSSPEVDAQASLTVAASRTPSGIVEKLGATTVAGVASVTTSGDWWGAVRGLSATPVSVSRIDLEWDPVTGATGYDIERDGVVIAEDWAATTYSDTGLATNTQYSYRVAAVPVQ